MQERSGFSPRAVFETCAVPGACLAGIVTVLLGGVCLADAFVVPCLFGPMAAVVIASDRLLCAARSSATGAAAVWTGVAFGWIAVASCMLHTPLISVSSLQWLVVIVIGSSAVCRLWARLVVSASELTPGKIAAVCVTAVGVAAELATLFGAAGAPLARVAAAIAIELVLIGTLRLVQVRRSRRDPGDSVPRATLPASVTAAFPAQMPVPEPAFA
jgi:hypothetical protein